MIRSERIQELKVLIPCLQEELDDLEEEEAVDFCEILNLMEELDDNA